MHQKEEGARDACARKSSHNSSHDFRHELHASGVCSTARASCVLLTVSQVIRPSVITCIENADGAVAVPRGQD
jgi:hypothetical protein